MDMTINETWEKGVSGREMDHYRVIRNRKQFLFRVVDQARNQSSIEVYFYGDSVSVTGSIPLMVDLGRFTSDYTIDDKYQLHDGIVPEKAKKR